LQTVDCQRMENVYTGCYGNISSSEGWSKAAVLQNWAS